MGAFARQTFARASGLRRFDTIRLDIDEHALGRVHGGGSQCEDPTDRLRHPDGIHGLLVGLQGRDRSAVSRDDDRLSVLYAIEQFTELGRPRR